MRGQINSGYDSYFNSLDQQLGFLPGQQTNLQNQANNWATGQISDLVSGTDQQKNDLAGQIGVAEQGQVKTLKDVSSNIRNLMNAGNTYLGSMGAGDSSAVNQYAYGLTKLGSQQRGDVQAQTKTIIDNIQGRIAKVGNILTQEKNRIQSELGNKMNDIATWFQDAQNQIVGLKGQAGMNKSRDLQALSTNIYNQAIQMATQFQQDARNRAGMVEEWALNSSTSAKQALAKAQEYASYMAPQQQAGQISGSANFAPQGTAINNYRGGGIQGLTEEQKRLLGLA
jgi:hypothetical protein